MNDIHLTADVRLAVRDSDDDGPALLEGRIVPYGETITHDGGDERFAEGALADVVPDDVMVLWQHDPSDPIGRARSIVEREDGAYATFAIADTTRGRDALALAREGVIRGLSIGFVPDEYEVDKQGVRTHSRVSVREFSLVTWPAYAGAEVTAVREEQTTMDTDNTSATPADSPETADDLEQRLRQVETEVATLSPAPIQTRQVRPDEWGAARLLAAAGDDAELRALSDVVGTAGGASTDAGALYGTSEYLASQLISVVDGRRPVFAQAGRMPFPSRGLSLTIPIVESGPAVDSGVAEKGDVPSAAMVTTLETFAAAIHKGGVDVSYELILQSDPAVLTVLWDRMLSLYAANTETDLIATASGGVAHGAALDTTTYAALVADLVTVSQAIYTATGAPGDRLALTTADWIAVLGLTDSGDRRQFSTGGSAANDGSGRLTAEAMDVGGILAFHAPQATDSFQFNAESLKVAERALTRLEVDNVSKAGRDVGIVGMTINALTIPGGVVRYAAVAAAGAGGQGKGKK